MTELEKIALQNSRNITIKFEPVLPCTTDGCLNEATVGNVNYNHSRREWSLIALCKPCTLKLMEMYSGYEPREAVAEIQQEIDEREMKGL